MFDEKKWMNFDAKYLEFLADPRNIRFTLSTDGAFPFVERNNTHNTRLVILMIYILITWLCQNKSTCC
jgi:hypothetical protein